MNQTRAGLARLLLSLLGLGVGLPLLAQPKLSAPHWVAQHWQPSGAITTLAEQNAAQPAQPASLTKLMTAYAVLRLMSSDAERRAPLTVSAECAATEGTRVGYRVGETVAIEDALQGLLAISGNDAACALAQHFDPVIGQINAVLSQNKTPPAQSCARLEVVDDFVAYMNATSRHTFGSNLCQWRNPHGLSQEGHLSTAQDLAIIAHALWHEFPFARHWLGRKTYTWNGVTQANRNTLLHRDPTVDGLKTGHTQAAGYNLATTQSQRVTIGNDAYDWRLATVVLGTASAQARADDSAALLAWARASYQPWRLYGAGELAGHWKLRSLASAVPLHLKDPLWAVLDKSVHPSVLRYEFHADTQLSAPYASGSSVGRMVAYLGHAEVGSAAVLTPLALDASPWYAFAWAWVKSWFSRSN